MTKMKYYQFIHLFWFFILIQIDIFKISCIYKYIFLIILSITHITLLKNFSLIFFLIQTTQIFTHFYLKLTLSNPFPNLNKA